MADKATFKSSSQRAQQLLAVATKDLHVVKQELHALNARHQLLEGASEESKGKFEVHPGPFTLVVAQCTDST